MNIKAKKNLLRLLFSSLEILVLQKLYLIYLNTVFEELVFLKN
jgi:hypothetical protein